MGSYLFNEKGNRLRESLGDRLKFNVGTQGFYTNVCMGWDMYTQLRVGAGNWEKGTSGYILDQSSFLRDQKTAQASQVCENNSRGQGFGCQVTAFKCF